jgi:hypothetical protein
VVTTTFVTFIFEHGTRDINKTWNPLHSATHNCNPTETAFITKAYKRVSHEALSAIARIMPIE